MMQEPRTGSLSDSESATNGAIGSEQHRKQEVKRHSHVTAIGVVVKGHIFVREVKLLVSRRARSRKDVSLGEHDTLLSYCRGPPQARIKVMRNEISLSICFMTLVLQYSLNEAGIEADIEERLVPRIRGSESY